MPDAVPVKGDMFGDRMKAYEAVETARRLDATLPIYARIDGRGFSKFTRGLARPFDPRMTHAMQLTTKHLVEATDALLGYTQSDEISLIWQAPPDRLGSQVFFDGKVQKLCSVLAGLATSAFTAAVLDSDAEFRSYATRLPHFDARVFGLPSREEGANAFLWREMDATRNAVSMAAFAQFSHKSLHGVSVAGMLERLTAAGVEFGNYPVAFRRGSYFRRLSGERALSASELARIPDRHRPPAGHLVTRSWVAQIDMPPFVEVTNRTAVVFDAVEPITRAETKSVISA